jgi:conjugative relaxase-like TrwC/TraI family protein
MLSPKAQYSPIDAKRYFKEHLAVGDYYTEGQHAPGQWIGKGAEDLGLSGVTTTEQFERLCDNLHPQTGERLTLRQKTTRMEIGADGKQHEAANRRVFYDFPFSPPKSVSIAALVGDDTRIVKAHEQAVTAAMNQLQSFAATRVRKNGQCADRATSNIVAAMFRHDTSRALDPHLHTHCIVFNATFDSVERQWKALQNYDMMAAQKFVENVYYHELARELVKFGYQIENQPRGDFEIKGVAPELIDKFSKRHKQIDDATRELLAKEPDKANGNIAAIRENIAHRERPPKVRDMGLEKLQRLWDGQMTAAEKNSIRNLAVNPPRISTTPTNLAETSVTWAEEHLFERRSVVSEHELWRHALEYARGQNVSLTEIQSVTKQRGYIRNEDKPGKVTIREHLQREWEIVCAAKDGRGKFGSFQPDYRSRNPRLDEEQRKAVERIIASTDFVTLFRGGAGTGKSFTLREVQGELEKAGHSVQVVAPQRQQVMDLERDGFTNAQTVSALLARRELPRDAVLLVDEAGQIGGRQMHALFRLAQDNHARLILSGDTRQHGAVEASDALRAIEKYSGLESVELANIRRQNPALAKSIAERERIKQYRQAVEAARDGNLAQSFHGLDKLKAIESCTVADQHEKLGARYLELTKEHQSCAVVSQSWNEIHKLNDEIRAMLKREKLIGESETAITGFQPLNLTDAQKRDARSYGPDSILVFNRPVRGFKAGDSVKLKSIEDGRLMVEHENKTVSIPFKQLDKVTVCQQKEMALAAGDKLQLKANGRAADNRKLANGELVTVKTVHADGRIGLTDGRVLDKNFRQFVRGYAITSYASQGKSVDYVLFSDSAVKAATNNQQWYVTISRGKKGIHIFTCDKQGLRENITRGGERPLAVDIVPSWVTNRLAWRLNNQRYGRQAAAIMERVYRNRHSESLREKASQKVIQRTIQQTPAVKQSRGIGV